MRIIIFANGKFKKSRSMKIHPHDFIIAADGGAEHCMGMGITPALIIGDLDSILPETLKKFQAGGTEIRQYPAKKDMTDLELALDTARDKDAEEIIILGALGGRWDMSLANVMLMTGQGAADIRIRMIDGEQEITLIKGEEKVLFHGQKGDTLSLIPLCGDVMGVSLEGLEYPLKNECLRFGAARGVSNVMCGNTASVNVKQGQLLCVLIHVCNGD